STSCVDRDDTVVLLRGDQVAGVAHAERSQDARLEKYIELLSGHRFDDIAEHTSARPVSPALPRCTRVHDRRTLRYLVRSALRMGAARRCDIPDDQALVGGAWVHPLGCR